METLMGYERADGSFGIRNHVIVIPSVVCANGVVEAIAREVPGAVPLVHGHGCGRGATDAIGHAVTLEKMCQHPNVAGALVIGLGCESVSAEKIGKVPAAAGRVTRRLVIQEEGGTQKTAAKGIKIVKSMLADAAGQKKTPFSQDKLIIGLECGGSDAFSGVSANPGIGRAADMLVDGGATVILTETTELIGTSHILQRRAANGAVKARIAEIIDNQEKKAEQVLGPMAKLAISPGNQDGGMSCITEKALGCVTKAGTRPVQQVVDYAEAPTEKGVVIMDGPGFDAESITGLAASGSQIIVFSTGRGTPLGFPIVPVIKVASTNRLYNNMKDDMDINAGLVLEGGSLDDVGHSIFELIQRVAAGERTRAEVNKQGGILSLYTQTTAF
jgi:altronate dehydratase large subunit